MRVAALQSGSNGNCIYVEAGNARLMFDAGIPGYIAQQRLAAAGIDVKAIDALLISHDHADHVRCMGVMQRKFGLPIHVTRKTLAAATRWNRLGQLSDVRHFAAGTSLRFDGITIETIPTPHDAADGVAFVVDDGECRLGILTDLGHVFGGLAEVVASLDAVIIESNYDPVMLERGSYPERLKARIRGPGGHLSNVEAAELLASAGVSLRWACLAHLSEHNNAPRVARRVHEETLGKRFPIHVATRYEATPFLEVAAGVQRTLF